MTSLAAQIEQVIRQYGWVEQHDKNLVFRMYMRESFIQDLVNDLLTLLVPRPVELEKLRGVIYNALPTSVFSKDGGTPVWFDNLVACLYSWATTPPPVVQTWCSHMVYHFGDQLHLRGWYYKQFQDWMLEQEWDRCPVKGCGQPRPAER